MNGCSMPTVFENGKCARMQALVAQFQGTGDWGRASLGHLVGLRQHSAIDLPKLLLTGACIAITAKGPSYKPSFWRVAKNVPILYMGFHGKVQCLGRCQRRSASEVARASPDLCCSWKGCPPTGKPLHPPFQNGEPEYALTIGILLSLFVVS